MGGREHVGWFVVSLPSAAVSDPDSVQIWSMLQFVICSISGPAEIWSPLKFAGLEHAVAGRSVRRQHGPRECHVSVVPVVRGGGGVVLVGWDAVCGARGFRLWVQACMLWDGILA